MVLIIRWNFIDVVDDEVIDGDFLGHEFEAELLLEGGEDIGEVGVRRIAGRVFWGKIQVEVVRALKPGPVDDRTFDWSLEYKGKRFIDSFQNLISLFPIIPWKGAPLLGLSLGPPLAMIRA